MNDEQTKTIKKCLEFWLSRDKTFKMINVVARRGVDWVAPIIVRNWQGCQTLEVDFYKEVNRYGKESGEEEN